MGSHLRASLFSDMATVSSPTETEQCIESLIAVFQRHAGRDGNNSKLSKAEFLIFMNTELGAFTKNQKDPGVLGRMMKKLDLNSDGQQISKNFLILLMAWLLLAMNTLLSLPLARSELESLWAWPPVHSLSFQPLSHLLFTAPTYPEPGTPTYPGRPLLLVIKQSCFLKHTHTK